MKIKLYLNKSLEENAAVYFDRAKKLRKKAQGAREALEKHMAKLEKLKKEDSKKKEKQERIKKTEKKWFHKFRWFISSEGFLVIAGRDATTNEIIIKKHTGPGDLVFHTEIAGSPFVVIKSEEKKIGKKTIEEAAIFCASFSSAWKQGRAEAEVYCISPEQVTKQAESGEYLKKGSFVIRGKRNYLRPRLELAVCYTKNGVMAGPLEAVKKASKEYVILKQGNSKMSDVAKKIQKKIHAELDEIIRALPQGISL